jgi:hypothetical protein
MMTSSLTSTRRIAVGSSDGTRPSRSRCPLPSTCRVTRAENTVPMYSTHALFDRGEAVGRSRGFGHTPKADVRSSRAPGFAPSIRFRFRGTNGASVHAGNCVLTTR